MPVSMYDASVPQFLHQLGALSAVLAKAEAHCAAKKIDPSVLTGFRLYPDMLPFTRQVLIACDFAKGASARLAGIDVPSYPDNEATFSELQARIERTKDFIASVAREKFDGSEDREISMKVGPATMTFNGQAYLMGFVWPNFYFHTATAYAILRHNGVELGKSDFLGISRPQ